MKKLKSMLVMLLTLTMMFTAAISVNADTTTDLKSMTVYAVDAAGNKTVLPMEFNSTTYSYDLTVMSTAVSISIDAATADATSTWSVIKDGINTKMDTGKNLTEVEVKSAAGTVQKYVLNTTKLTEAEEATYKAPEVNTDDTTPSADDTTVMVGKKEMKIASSFDKNLIPEGFKKDKAEYGGKSYACIKGEVKELTAFYLYNDEVKDFYIYNAENNKFYLMDNIKIKSRMYTIVNTGEPGGFLKNYQKKEITIIDRTVKAWALDEEEGMYLVYAMNWNGDTSLYCYDDNEKCFQRYLVSANADTQTEAANKAYENLQKKYNNLVDKYNIMLKVLCGLAILIVILIFVIINLAITKKEKKVKADKKKRTSKTDGKDIESTATDKKYYADEAEAEDDFEYEFSDEDTDDEIDDEDIATEELEEADDETVEDEVEEDEISEEPKHTFLGRKKYSDRTYGDEPTLGSAAQSDKGFYGGEIDDEDDILIDITDDDIESADKEEKTIAELQHETEEDLKATLKSMLPDEQDDEEDDDDFEFIDLN